MKFTEIPMDGAVALVTGGARGIGLAIAHRLAGMGARVMIADLDGAAANEAAREVGSGARGFFLDVTEFDEYLRVVTEIEDSIGPVDIVVNNAGIMPVGPLLGESRGWPRRQCASTSGATTTLIRCWRRGWSTAVEGISST